MTLTSPTRTDPSERTAVGVSRPGLGERAAVFAVIVFLIVGLPLDWFNPPVRGQVVGGESPFVVVVFLGLAGLSLYFLNGNWHLAWKILARSRLVVAFHALMAASAFWSVSPVGTARRVVAIGLAATIGVHLLVRFSQLEIFRMISWAFLGSVLINLAFFFGFPDLARTFDERTQDFVITGVFSNKNSFGQMGILAIFAFAVAIRADRRRRVVWFGAMLLALFLVSLSQSKTALATGGMGVLMLIGYQVFRARKTMFGAVWLSVVGGSIGTIAFTVANLEFLTGLLGRDDTLSGRVPLWESVITLLSERPFFGHGWAAFWDGWFSPSHQIWIENRWLPPSAHNGFLDLWTQLGLVGFVLGVWMFGRGLRRGTLHAQRVPGIYGLWPLGMISIAVVYSMSESSLIGRHFFWTLTVMALIVVDQPLQLLSLPTPARSRMLAAAKRRLGDSPS